MTSHQEIRPALTREELEAHWMPYTGNRQFKDDPRMIVAAEGVHLIDDRGRRILDGLSGLWCTGAGHNRREIAEAVYKQMQTLDYSPAFQFGHPGSFQPDRIADARGAGLRILHQLRLGVRGHLVEDGPGLLAPEGTTHQDQAHRQGSRLPWGEFRRYLRGRYRRQSQAVWSGRGCGSSVALLPLSSSQWPARLV